MHRAALRSSQIANVTIDTERIHDLHTYVHTIYVYIYTYIYVYVSLSVYLAETAARVQ